MVAGMIKPWQKATLGVMMGAAVYTGFLYHWVEETTQHNRQLAWAQTQLKQRQALLAALQTELHDVQVLKSTLQQIDNRTLQINQEINQVKTQIQSIKAGQYRQQIQAVTNAPPITQNLSSAQQVSVPTVRSTPAPSVQAVSRASGG